MTMIFDLIMFLVIGLAATVILPGLWTRARNIEGIAAAAGIGLAATVVFLLVDVALLQPFGAYTFRWRALGGGSNWWYHPVWWMVGTYLAWMGAFILANQTARNGRPSVGGLVALVLIGATYVLINWTKLGKAMRATFQDRDTAALMGVNIKGIYTATFAIGSGLAAAAGALLGPVFLVTPSMGDLASLKAFAIVILGGLGNITGATLGGFILAFVEEIGAGYISSGYRDAMGFLIIIIVLLFKPTGLFARAERIG